MVCERSAVGPCMGDRGKCAEIVGLRKLAGRCQVGDLAHTIRERAWFDSSRQYFEVDEMDVVIGLTYGTPKTTNNKENQILAKLLDHGFEEEDREGKPGVLICQKTRAIRVYRCIGKEFWAFIGDPGSPNNAPFVFLEVLLALSMALSKGSQEFGLESTINKKIDQLAYAISELKFPVDSLPDWIRGNVNDNELVRFATAMSAFYDKGI